MLAASLILAALIGSPFTPRVAVPVTSGAVSATVAPAAFNPSATARAHAATITVTPLVDGTVQTVVESPNGSPITTLGQNVSARAGQPLTYTWDGAGAADGTYGIHVSLTDAQGIVNQAVTPVLIDTEAPRVTLRTLAPATTARGPVDVHASTADPSGASTIALAIATQTDDPIGTVPMTAAADGASGSASWNLRVRKRLLLPGVYHLRAVITDGAGNVGTSEPRTLRVSRAVKPRIIYSLPEAGNAIGLSFDDCTENRDWLRIVNAFKAADARTTFFCNGVNVRSNPEAARAAVAAGNSIGSHTWAHPQMPTLSVAEQVSQMQGDIDIWWKTARAVPTPLFRPPYGLHDASTLRAAGSLGFSWVVMWNVDPSDYLDPPAPKLIESVVRDARKGSIVVMHANANTAAAVPQLIRALRAKGLEPKSLDEMLGTAAQLAPAGS